MATQASENFVQQLYVAYYGRPADSDGLQYWADRADTEGQGAIVNAFGESQEYQDSYGDLSNEELVNNLYQQLFSRDADDAGLEYYTGVLESGDKTLSEIALTISNAAQGSDRVVLNTKVQAADYYTSNVSDGNYDVSFAQKLLAGIDETNTGADYDSAVDSIDNATNADEAASDYAALQAAQKALVEAQDALTEASEELAENDLYAGIVGNDGEVSVQELQGYVTTQQNALNTSVTANTDAELATAVTEAKADIKAVEGQFTSTGAAFDANAGGQSYTAAQLLARSENAEAALEADVEADGETLALAKDLNASIAAYLANSDTDPTSVTDLQAAVGTYLGDPTATDAESLLLDAVKAAEDAIFTVGDDKESNLEAGEAGDTLESLVKTLDERNDLFDADASAETALTTALAGESNDDGVNLVTALDNAQTAVEDRAELRENLAEAEADLADLKSVQADVETAEDNVEAAQDELGYDNVVAIEDADLDASGDSNFFTYDKQASDSVAIGSFQADDAIYVGSGYTLGDAEDLDDSVLEVAFAQSGADTEVSIENFADATAANTVTLTLTGVNSDDVNFNADTGVISIA